MQVVNSIKKAREKNVTDHLILQEIRKQNPDKEPFFKKAEERGADATKILDEIIKQNSPKESTLTAPQSSSPADNSTEKAPLSPPPAYDKNHQGQNKTTNKTLLTKEAQEEEEDMRKNFLKRIEAKERGESIDGDGFFSPSNTPNANETSQEMTEGASPSSGIPKIMIVLMIGVFLLVGFAFLIFSLF